MKSPDQFNARKNTMPEIKPPDYDFEVVLPQIQQPYSVRRASAPDSDFNGLILDNKQSRKNSPIKLNTPKLDQTVKRAVSLLQKP